MGGLYSLLKTGVQRIRREHWGMPVSAQDLVNDQTKDPGLQDFVDELLAGLGSTQPVQMPDSLTLVAPQNSTALQFVVNNNDQQIFEIVNNVTNETVNLTVNNIQDITEIIQQNTTGFSGSVTVVTNATFSASVSGCVVTITPSFTTQTLTFQSGLCTGAS